MRTLFVTFQPDGEVIPVFCVFIYAAAGCCHSPLTSCGWLTLCSRLGVCMCVSGVGSPVFAFDSSARATHGWSSHTHIP